MRAPQQWGAEASVAQPGLGGMQGWLQPPELGPAAFTCHTSVRSHCRWWHWGKQAHCLVNKGFGMQLYPPPSSHPSNSGCLSTMGLCCFVQNHFPSSWWHQRPILGMAILPHCKTRAEKNPDFPKEWGVWSWLWWEAKGAVRRGQCGESLLGTLWWHKLFQWSQGVDKSLLAVGVFLHGLRDVFFHGCTCSWLPKGLGGAGSGTWCAASYL